ncbi:hypothetical protein SDC9_194864 [bioreactor metagenome]|uniref:Uncharacterized protein n=1 Tax=bioreactor metagenome TaxID=1076179 RepID=A0A645I8X4_9ZZZZ
MQKGSIGNPCIHNATSIAAHQLFRPRGLTGTKQQDRLPYRSAQIVAQGRCADFTVVDLHPFMAKDNPRLVQMIDIQRPIQALPGWRSRRSVADRKEGAARRVRYQNLRTPAAMLCLERGKQVVPISIPVDFRCPEVVCSPKIGGRGEYGKGAFPSKEIFALIH